VQEFSDFPADVQEVVDQFPAVNKLGQLSGA